MGKRRAMAAGGFDVSDAVVVDGDDHRSVGEAIQFLLHSFEPVRSLMSCFHDFNNDFFGSLFVEKKGLDAGSANQVLGEDFLLLDRLS